LRSVALESKLSDFDSCGSHLIRYNVTVNIECGSDVRVPHHLLLHRNVIGPGVFEPG
jgi:hypothetical protein